MNCVYYSISNNMEIVKRELRDKDHVAREHGLQPKRHGSSVPVRIGRPGIRVMVKMNSTGSGSTQSTSNGNRTRAVEQHVDVPIARVALIAPVRFAAPPGRVQIARLSGAPTRPTRAGADAPGPP
jgi:hypothetical protein